MSVLPSVRLLAQNWTDFHENLYVNFHENRHLKIFPKICRSFGSVRKIAKSDH